MSIKVGMPAVEASINCFDLLKRYMLHVVECEGVTFLHQVNSERFTNVRFSEREVELLKEIERGIEN